MLTLHVAMPSASIFLFRIKNIWARCTYLCSDNRYGSHIWDSSCTLPCCHYPHQTNESCLLAAAYDTWSKPCSAYSLSFLAVWYLLSLSRKKEIVHFLAHLLFVSIHLTRRSTRLCRRRNTATVQQIVICRVNHRGLFMYRWYQKRMAKVFVSAKTKPFVILIAASSSKRICS